MAFMFASLHPCEKAGRLVRLIAWIQLAAFVAVMAAIFIPGFMGGPKVDRAPFILTSAALISGVLTWAQLALGTAITARRSWARPVGIVYFLASVFAFPIGTLLGLYGLWCLWKGWDKSPEAA